MFNDLLSYSIMLNGEKAITHTAPHYAPLALGTKNVTLPPITSYVSLTENNLNKMNFLQSLRNGQNSATPSLTLLLAEELPLSSPRMAAAEFASPKLSSQAEEPTSKKRRQRLGPSCDLCRARKVKCNAEVIMLSRLYTEEDTAALSSDARDQLAAGQPVSVGGYSLVLSNGKLVKFKPCLSCAGKGLGCCFSKGFTKEDIVHSKRSGSEVAVVEKKPVAAKVVKKRVEVGTRKSSCVACRKRKVKCVMNTRANKCVGCVKKDSMCSFETC